jgi:hypothetical protein
VISALIATVLASAPALPCAPRAGDPDAEVRARACDLLGAIDRPVPDAAWRGLGPAADRLLVEIASSPGFAVHRARALEGLAARGGPGAGELLRTLATSTDAPAAVRRAAIRGLGRLLSTDAVVATLRPLLERDPDLRVRAAAAETLVRRAPAESCPLIHARAASPGEAIPLERAVAACGPVR